MRCSDDDEGGDESRNRPLDGGVRVEGDHGRRQNAGDSAAEMPLQFIIDQDLPRDIRTITLSYTIFDVTDMANSQLAAR